MTVKERIDYLVSGATKSDLEFLATRCHQVYTSHFKKEADVQLTFGYNSEVGWDCWVLKEKNTNYQVTCDTLRECYECFLRFIFENIYGIA